MDNPSVQGSHQWESGEGQCNKEKHLRPVLKDNAIPFWQKGKSQQATRMKQIYRKSHIQI